MTDSSCSYFSLKLVNLIVQALEVIHYKAGNNRNYKTLFWQKADKVISYVNNFKNIVIY